MASPAPALSLNVAFPGAGVIDVTGDMRIDNWATMRGASQLITTGFVAAAGSLTTTLANRLRQYDPLNASGPYYADLMQGVPMFMQATWNAVLYDVFAGYVDDWPQVYPNAGFDNVIPFKCTDGTIRFAQAQIKNGRPPELGGARINADLAEMDVGAFVTPATSIARGNAQITRRTRGSTSAQSLISDVVMAEWAEFYWDDDGTMVFRDRDTIASDPRSLTPQAIYTDTEGDPLKYADLQMTSLPIINDVTLTHNDRGAKVYAEDLVSQNPPYTWGKRSLNLTLPIVTGSQARQYARWLVRRYGYQLQKPYVLTIYPQENPDLWFPEVLGRKLGDMVQVVRDPVPHGDPITENVWIRGIAHGQQGTKWTTKFWLQDASWIEGLAHYDVSVYDGPDVYGL